MSPNGIGLASGMQKQNNTDTFTTCSCNQLFAALGWHVLSHGSQVSLLFILTQSVFVLLQ
jgi:hypothetical protein